MNNIEMKNRQTEAKHKERPTYFADKCEKRGYATRKDAKTILKAMKKKGQAVNGHTYKCAKCERWHVTSMKRVNAQEVEEKIRRGFIK